MLSQRTLVSRTITTALTAVIDGPIVGLYGMRQLAIEAKLAYGSAGTTLDVWIQTSLDAGNSWIDIAQFAFLVASLRTVHTVVMPAIVATRTNVTPLDGTLGDNLIQDGILGDRIRSKITSTGTYAGGTILTVNFVPKG